MPPFPENVIVFTKHAQSREEYPISPGRDSARALHFHNDRIWYFQVGTSYLNAWSPEGKRFNWFVHDVLGISGEELDRSQHKRTFKGVKPSQVREYIYKMGLEPTPI